MTFKLKIHLFVSQRKQIGPHIVYVANINTINSKIASELSVIFA